MKRISIFTALVFLITFQSANGAGTITGPGQISFSSASGVESIPSGSFAQTVDGILDLPGMTPVNNGVSIDFLPVSVTYNFNQNYDLDSFFLLGEHGSNSLNAVSSFQLAFFNEPDATGSQIGTTYFDTQTNPTTLVEYNISTQGFNGIRSFIFTPLTASDGTSRVEYSEIQFSGTALPGNNTLITANGPINFGTAIVGANLSNSGVLLSKTGTQSTTVGINTTSTDVTVSPNGSQGLASGSVTLPLTIGVNTSTAGNKSGDVVLDNLASTSAGSALGSDDPDDLISVSATILDHANASFSSAADQNVLTIDFGSIAANIDSLSESFSLSNLLATAGFTAGLDLDSIAPSGDVGVLTTDMATFSNLAAGSSQNLSAFFDTSTLGTFDATYLLTLSDQDLVGAVGGQVLTLNLTGSVVPEPGTLSLLALGGVVALLHRRRLAASGG